MLILKTKAEFLDPSHPYKFLACLKHFSDFVYRLSINTGTSTGTVVAVVPRGGAALRACSQRWAKLLQKETAIKR
jgi:hypothetical protein